MLIVETLHHGGRAAVDRLVLAFDERCRSRLRCRLESGMDAGLMLPRGSVLRDGDLLEARDGRVIEVIAALEDLMEVRCGDPRRLARAAYHLGNRHVPLQVGEGWIRFAADHVLRGMLAGMGFEVRHVVDAFDPEGGAYGPAHGHAHAYVDREYAPRIHEGLAP